MLGNLLGLTRAVHVRREGVRISTALWVMQSTEPHAATRPHRAAQSHARPNEPKELHKGPTAGMHWKGGSYPPPHQVAQPMPSHCPPEGKCQLQWHL